MPKRPGANVMATIAMLLVNGGAFADGPVVDKIYDPYVQALERELEYRFTTQNDDDDSLDSLQIHRLGFGMSWSDRWFTEIYVIADRSKQKQLAVTGYELEAKWQMTEQGEYWADWGLLFEFEAERGDAWEYATTLLMSKEWGRWVSTANAGIIFEWGDDIGEDWETSLSLQGRYRLSRGFEPALEFYAGESAKGLGPVFLGDIRTGGKSKLHWEAGLIFGLDNHSPDQTWRGLLELEF
jgi:hypothetical protein